MKWVKQLTRENTLLERGIRTLAYAQSVREIGNARAARNPIVGFGNVTSFYIDPADYEHQQGVIWKEFHTLGEHRLCMPITRFLEEGYRWATSFPKKRLTRPQFIDYFIASIPHHAHARGAIVYGYWGEPRIQKALRRSLKHKVPGDRLDEILSILSTPHPATPKLRALYHTSRSSLRKKTSLMRSLRLTKRERALVNTLSWCTFFYEYGERVASRIYYDTLWHLKQLYGPTVEKTLQWYDPDSLIRYVKGTPLSPIEVRRRKRCYILMVTRSKLYVLSGKRALALYNRDFAVTTKRIAHAELRGTVACAGSVRGTARIVTTEADQKKMRTGDILISPMTTPRLMTAVRKAAAIVTDEGGLTAHAAIVSREFGIPCIVGTKFATTLFKDGDLVEVDAVHGIVRKI